jgi:hypothetical protein
MTCVLAAHNQIAGPGTPDTARRATGWPHSAAYAFRTTSAHLTMCG